MNLDNFLTQTPVNKLITDSSNLYFILSNNESRDKGYIFNIEYPSLSINGFKEIDLKDTGYYLNNTMIYIY
ncbi:hypothetical protein D3C71_2194000 [compost metagenome]